MRDERAVAVSLAAEELGCKVEVKEAKEVLHDAYLIEYDLRRFANCYSFCNYDTVCEALAAYDIPVKEKREHDNKHLVAEMWNGYEVPVVADEPAKVIYDFENEHAHFDAEVYTLDLLTEGKFDTDQLQKALKNADVKIQEIENEEKQSKAAEDTKKHKYRGR